MNKIIKNLITVLLAAALFISFSQEAFGAGDVLHGYYVLTSDLGSDAKKYISSIYLANNDPGWTLYINGNNLGCKEGNIVSFEYNPNQNTGYVLSFDIANAACSIYYQKSADETVVSILHFSIQEATQTVQFLSDPDASPIIKTAEKDINGYYDFGEFSFRYKDQDVGFSLKLNSNTNTVIITRAGKEYTYPVVKTGKYETVYCEALVEAQEIDIDYMASSLEKLSYSAAKSVLYSESDINSALSNYRYTLVNNKTGLTKEVPLSTRITQWKRNEDESTLVGDGTYTESVQSVQVVCQWGEDLCSSIRAKYGEDRRPFAVYGTETQYSYVEKSTTKVNVKQYQNISWPDSSWVGPVSFSTVYQKLDKDYGVFSYRRAKVSWGDFDNWTGYTSAAARTCNNDKYCQYETQTMYAYATRSWGDWSEYIYSNCTPIEGELECRTKNRYAKKTRSWGAWSDYIYTAAESNSCVGVASSSDTGCERQAGTMYRKKIGTYSTWGNFSDWENASCTSSNLKNCESRTVYSWRSMGNWSAWEKTTLNTSCTEKYTSSGGEKNLNLKTKDCKIVPETRYRTRSFKEYKYSGYGDYSLGKYGLYVAGCKSSIASSSLCGVKEYKSCRAEACGAESYTYNSCRTSSCGVESVTYNLCRTSACGVDSVTYKMCRDSGCGIQSTTYNSCRTSACGVESVEYKTCACSACGCKTYNANASVCGRTKLGTAKRCAAAGCQTYNRCQASACGVKSITYKSCENSACGVKGYTYKYCRTSGCGVESTTYKSCRASACGVASTTYKICENSACGVKSTTYKACKTSACGVASYNSCNLYSCPSERTAEYTAWSSWSDWSEESCVNTGLQDCDTRSVNYARTRQWGDWSLYLHQSIPEGGATDYKSRTETRHQDRTLNWGNWSDYIYSSCTESDTLKCGSETRYRIRYIGDWSSLSTYKYDDCEDDAFTMCSSKSVYSKRSMGDWSDDLIGVNASGIYTVSSCTDTQTKKCYSQKQIRSRYKTPGTYGGWSIRYRSLDDISCDEDYSYEYKYSNGELTTDKTKGSSTVIGTGTMFVKELPKGRATIDTAVVATRSYTVSSRMTSSEILDFADDLSKSASAADIVSNWASDSDSDIYGSKYVSWEDYENSLGSLTVSGNASVRFLNEKRFIPYVFITRHHRAVNAKFYIEGYENEEVSPQMTIRTTEESSQDNIKLYPDSEAFCKVYPDAAECSISYCSAHPEDHDCYCEAHPNAAECTADYCTTHMDEDICFCSKYPMSARCQASKLDTAVIYYNYTDPLENYSRYTLPSNWEGYSQLVDEIKASDFSTYQIQVTLKKSDLELMRQWIESNPDKVGTGEMIKQFSYIFSSQDDEFVKFLEE